MIISIPKEIKPYETRVAATPETVHKFIRLGLNVKIEQNAGQLAGFSDEEYRQAGAEICTNAQQTYSNANLILKINAPQPQEDIFLQSDMTIIGNFQALDTPERTKDFARLGVQCFALDLIPRISRAQSMDILSSQNNLAGYRAVIEALNHFNKATPLMMTAAGTVPPAKVLVLGVGVAGLQAIATAKRLGAQVYASDIRPETQEQTISLGAKFVEKLTSDLLNKIDIIITIAITAGKKAPILLKDSQLLAMSPNSIIIDMAADNGGNTEATQADKIIIRHGIKIIGNSHLATMIPNSASRLFANNIYNFIAAVFDKESQQLTLNFQDELIRQTCICRNGEVL
ncbi:MAG: NAD(P)(+) transhydrogenase (Re/Si-specific) subunit alpha [Alphaproteobacteria bacterium]|nr:NAD(P)(+) transhydrogenase (Re/Si-specific) subunit alpha [Alphaproteobacteria bacterium]